VRKHDRAIAIVMVIEHDARMRAAHQLGQLTLALLDRHPAQILAVELDQIESAEHCFVAMTHPADKFKHCEAVVVGDDRLAVD
jgi:hypothetical protein